MKVTLIANVSANGKILLSENTGYQAPQEAIAEFMRIAANAGNMIMGKKTFEMLQRVLGDVKTAFAGIEPVLLSTTGVTTNEYKVAAHPGEAIQYLAGKGFDEIVVGGGTITYNAFLEKELITDIYFNIHPVIVGNGGILITNHELVSDFKLSAHKLITGNVVQLHLIKV